MFLAYVWARAQLHVRWLLADHPSIHVVAPKIPGDSSRGGGGDALPCRRLTGGHFGLNPDHADGPVGDKAVEGFQGALLRGNYDQASAYLSQSKALLVTPLRCDSNGAKHTAWHIACGAVGQANPELLEFLHERFVALCMSTPLEDVLNQVNKRGRTCLGVACSARSQECVRWLLLHGANAFHADKSGKTALHEASSRHGSILKLA